MSLDSGSTHGAAPPNDASWALDDRLVGATALDAALRSLSRASVGVVLVGADMRFVFVNDIAAEINGHPAQEHLGATIQEVLGDTGHAVVPLLQGVLTDGLAVLGHEIVGETQARPGDLRTWEGDYLPFRLSHESAEPDAVLIVFIDVTEERRAARRLRQLIDGLFTFVGLCDIDGTLLEANEFALDAAGLRSQDVIGRPFWDCYWWSYDEAAQRRLRESVAEAVQGRACRYDTTVRIAGGRLIPIDFQLVPIIEHGRVVSLVPSGIDIEARVSQISDLAELASLAADLHRALGMHELIDLVVGRASGIFGTSIVTLGVVDHDEGTLLVTSPIELDSDIADRWRHLALDGPRTPFHDVAETGQPVWLSDQAERRDRYPDMADDSDRAGLVATASLPLTDATGTIGVLGLGWSGTVTDDPTTRLHASLFANLCSQALQRVMRTRSTTDLLTNLTGELMARRDHATSLDVAVGYVPAVSEIGFGGDWFDVATISETETALIVGDIAGHDVRSAAQMAVTRSALRTAVLALPSLVGISTLVTRSLGLRTRQFFATALVVVVNSADKELRWKSFGHVPAVLATPDGTVTLLAESGPPIGMLTDAAPIGTAAFTPGSRLVLYTDGLVETRTEPITERLAALVAVIEAAPSGTAAELLDHLMETLVTDSPGDDVAIVSAVL